MSKVLYFLREFEGDDIDWFIAIGSKMALPEGHALITANKAIDAIYIVIEGRLKVIIGSNADPIATLGVGELVGELSFLDSRPPNATVTAATDTVVMALPRLLLQSKLKKDPAFSGRFYKAIGVLLANRLRQTVINLGHPDRNHPDYKKMDEQDPELDLAGEWFKFIMAKFNEIQNSATT